MYAGSISLVGTITDGRSSYCYIQDAAGSELKIVFANDIKDYVHSIKVVLIQN